MSLVNEALKRARLDAARQEAARRGLPLPEATSGTSRSLRRPWLALSLALAAVALGALLFLAGRGSASRATAGAPVAVPASPPAAAPAGEPAASSPGPEAAAETPTPQQAAAPGPPNQAAPASAPAAAERTAAAAPPRRRVPRPEPAPVAEVPAAEVPATAPAPAQRGEAAAPARIHVGEVELDGVGKLELDGIAWTENRPFALINGRVVAPGESISGLRVLRIDPQEVELQGDRGEPIVLRLR